MEIVRPPRNRDGEFAQKTEFIFGYGIPESGSFAGKMFDTYMGVDSVYQDGSSNNL